MPEDNLKGSKQKWIFIEKTIWKSTLKKILLIYNDTCHTKKMKKKIQKISIRIHVITNVDVNCLVDIQWLSSHSCISISIFAITYNEIRHLKLFHHINS